MDILSDIFTTLNFSGTLYFRTEFAGRWAVTVPTLESAARFHLVIKGRCHVAIAGGPAHVLHPGDLILVPRGKSHILSDSARTTAPPLETVIERSGYTGNGLLVYGTNAPGLETQLVCGHFSFRPSADHPILRYLPDSIIASAQDRAKMPLLDEALRLITERAFSENLGSTAALTRLSEIIFVEILQSRLRGDEGLAFLLEALQDPKIAKSLQLIHSNPGKLWTVESLASEVAMSRSRFSDRFRKLVGQTPMAYLAQWRLQKSLELLSAPHRSIQQVANDTGYQSSAAFARAFHCQFGVAPRQYRLQALA